jgi:hypothetical protein
MSDPERVGNAGRGLAWEEGLLFERSRPGRVGYSLPALDVPEVDAAATLGTEMLREDLPDFPEVSEVGTRRWTWASIHSAPAP